MAETKDIDIIQSRQIFPIIPQTIEQLSFLAKKMAVSHMMPKGMEKEEDIFVAVLMGLEVGLSPMQAVQNISVINGRPSIWGDASIGLVQASQKLESIEEFFEGEGDKYKAVCILKRKGQPKIIKREFSVADAKRANLWTKGGTWHNYPKRMLQMRARSWALRDGFADVLKGLSIVEEAIDKVQDMYMESIKEEINHKKQSEFPSGTFDESISSDDIDTKFNEMLPKDIDEQILYAFIHKCVSVTNKKSEDQITAQDVKADAIENMKYFLKAFEKFDKEFKAEQKKEKEKESKPRQPRKSSSKVVGMKQKEEPSNGDVFSKLRGDRKLWPDTYKSESIKLGLPLDPDELTLKNAELLHKAIHAKADRDNQADQTGKETEY